MGAELTVSSTRASLSDILKPLSVKQREFYYLRLMGLEDKKVLSLIKRGKDTLCKIWPRDESFKSIGEYLAENADRYSEEATAFIRGKVLASILAMGLEWETLSGGDKRYVMRAVELVYKKNPLPLGMIEESYEQKLKRIRRAE